MSYLFHEKLYRSSPAMEKLTKIPVTICGAGALGANIAESLARSGVSQLTVIDCDRLDERNLSTQPYYRDDVGAKKVALLEHHLYEAVGVELNAVAKKLLPDNASRLLKDSGLVIDAFDNSEARQAVTDACWVLQIPCLHAGLSPDFSEVLWNEQYRVPSDVNDDICDYPLARNLVMLTVAIATEIAIRYITTGEKENRMITFQDFSVTALAP